MVETRNGSPPHSRRCVNPSPLRNLLQFPAPAHTFADTAVEAAASLNPSQCNPIHESILRFAAAAAAAVGVVVREVLSSPNFCLHHHYTRTPLVGCNAFPNPVSGALSCDRHSFSTNRVLFTFRLVEREGCSAEGVPCPSLNCVCGSAMRQQQQQHEAESS